MDLAFANVFTLRDLLDPAPPPGGEGTPLSSSAGAEGLKRSAPPGPLGKELDKESLKTSPRGNNAKNRGGGGANWMKHLRLGLLGAERDLDAVEGELVDLGAELDGWVFADSLWGVVGRLREVVSSLIVTLSAREMEKAQVR